MWNGLNVYVPRKSIHWNPNSQGNDFRRWGLREVIRSWEWSPYEWKSCPYKRGPRELSCPFYHMRLQWEDSGKWTRKWTFTRLWICWCFDLGLSASWTVRNKFVFLISHPVYGILLQQPELTENVWLDLFHFLVFILKNNVTNIPTLTTQLLAFLIFAYSLLFIKEIRYYK